MSTTQSELQAAQENLNYAKREYNAGRISLRVLDMARARARKAQQARGQRNACIGSPTNGYFL